MITREKTIDHGTLRRLVDAGVHVGAEVVASGGSWVIVINHGGSSQKLVATRGRPKTFWQFETLASYLRALGIVQYRVNAAELQPGWGIHKRAPDRRRVTASEHLKRAHKAAAGGAWFREQVQASIDDRRPSVGSGQARAYMAARRQALRNQAGTKPEGKAAAKSSR